MLMKTRRLFAAVVILTALPFTVYARRKPAPRASSSGVKVYTVTKSYSTLSFTATKWMVFKEEGLFQDFSGTLTYSAQDPSQCRIDVPVKAATLHTPNWLPHRALRPDHSSPLETFPTLSL